MLSGGWGGVVNVDDNDVIVEPYCSGQDIMSGLSKPKQDDDGYIIKPGLSKGPSVP